MKIHTTGFAVLWTLVVLLFVLAGNGFADSHMGVDEDSIDEETLEIYKRGVRWVSKTSHGRFILAGEVVDQDGKRLKDVELGIRMDTLVGIGWDIKTDFQRETINHGLFQVDVRPYTGVNLRFQKEGYYTTKKDFDFEKINLSRMNISPEDQEAIMSGKDVKIEEGVVRDENIRIVMEKKGNITTLIEKDFKLVYRRQEDGTASGRVVNFDRDRWPRGYYFQKPRNPIKATNLLDPEVIPPMCVYMIPKVDDDGRILSEIKIRPEGQLEFQFPNELRIISNDPEGGFIVYEQEKEKQAYWAMKLAPTNGYKKEIILDADLLYRRSPYVTSKGDDGIYFYFKINGRYGKGVIGSPRFPEGDYALELKTEFQLQVDGSRNLDTGRD